MDLFNLKELIVFGNGKWTKLYRNKKYIIGG